MSRLINTTTMTVDGVTDVGEWYVSEGGHNRAGRDVGCGELARHVLANGLVDELRFWLHPAVWGEGTRPYQGETVRMRLLDSTSYDSGVTLLRYEPLGQAR